MREMQLKTRLILALTGLSLSGCATYNLDDSLTRLNRDAPTFTLDQLALARTESQSQALRQQADRLLTAPISQETAVRLAMVNSPNLQAMLAQAWVQATLTAQSGRIANPAFTFERIRFKDELELGRLLAFGLIDLASLPWRARIANARLEQQQLELTSKVIDEVTQIRQAWIRAVAAKQALSYARQVNDAAQASAELARRMLQAGNFNKLQRARQQAFYAEAAGQLAQASHRASASREQLIRLLGLGDDQATSLVLPDRLPDLPDSVISPQQASATLNETRLDIRMAKAAVSSIDKAFGLNLVNSFTDIEIGLRKDTVFENHSGSKDTRRGYEVSLKLPVFDWGDLRRASNNGQALVALNQAQATVRAAASSLREGYSAYRTAHDVAKHYRDEIVPLRKTIAEENLLRYNGMIIGVFELLADSRVQIGSVIASISALEQFWLAEAALQAALVGKPMMTSLGAGNLASLPSDSGAH